MKADLSAETYTWIFKLSPSFKIYSFLPAIQTFNNPMITWIEGQMIAVFMIQLSFCRAKNFGNHTYIVSVFLT